MIDTENLSLLEAKKYGDLAKEIAELLAQPKPAPVLLTDDEIWAIWHASPHDGAITVKEFARAIEAAVLKKQGIET